MITGRYFTAMSLLLIFAAIGCSCVNVPITKQPSTGTRIVYRSNGKPKIEEDYDKAGHPVAIRLFHENGRQAVQGSFKWNAEAHKEFNLFMEPHDVGKDFNYGDYHGIWIYWNTEGKLIAKGEWRNGQPWNGTCRVRLVGRTFAYDRFEFQRYKNGKMIQGSAVESSWADGE